MLLNELLYCELLYLQWIVIFHITLSIDFRHSCGTWNFLRTEISSTDEGQKDCAISPRNDTFRNLVQCRRDGAQCTRAASARGVRTVLSGRDALRRVRSHSVLTTEHTEAARALAGGFAVASQSSLRKLRFLRRISRHTEATELTLTSPTRSVCSVMAFGRSVCSVVKNTLPRLRPVNTERAEARRHEGIMQNQFLLSRRRRTWLFDNWLD